VLINAANFYTLLAVNIISTNLLITTVVVICQSESSPLLSLDVDLAAVAEHPRCNGMRQILLFCS